MDAKILVAVIAGSASVVAAVIAAVVAIINARRTGRLQQQILEQTETFQRDRDNLLDELETRRLRLSKDLEEQRATRDARRDYEYEARKRLYQECEPLVFQASELAEAARRRIISLARSTKRGQIRADGSGWLDHSGYFFKSTVYMLLAPTTTAKILQRRLTQVDLSLERPLQMQYELLKGIYFSWTSDFDLAEKGPALPYEPDLTDPDEPDRDRRLKEDPARYRRQGLYFGTLEILSECLVVADSSRCKSFGEFLRDWDEESSSIHGHIDDFLDLFQGLHPTRLPVLWRILTLQHLQHSLFLALQREGNWKQGRASEIARRLPIDLDEFDWRAQPNDADDSVRQTLDMVQGYLVGMVDASEGRRQEG